MVSFSVLILAKNEENDLGACLSSLSSIDDKVVVDCYSTDRTSDIALEFGARVFRKPNLDKSLPFGGDEGKYRTWTIREINFRYRWVFVLDADERLSLNSISELDAISNTSDTNTVAYRIKRRDYFQGRELKHVQTSAWYIRFLQPNYVHYERRINCITVVDGNVGNLQFSMNHYPFSKGLSYWFERHNNYSTYEALQIIDNKRLNTSFSFYSAFFDADFNIRRYHQKELFYRSPARPLIKFVLLYFVKRGFLDGRQGFIYSLLQTIYEFMIVLKVHELEHRHKS